MAKAHTSSLAERFVSAWNALEFHLANEWCEFHRPPNGRPPVAFQLISWAGEQRLITRDMETFLQHCRDLRNAFAHVCFDGYSGPVAFPPSQVVTRLEKILRALRHPPEVGVVAAAAVTCSPDTSLREALKLMDRGDFSQLPYRHGDLGWLLVTRGQVGRWVEVRAKADGMAFIDLGVPVWMLAEDPDVGPVVPRCLDGGATLASAVAAIEDALHRPDEKDGGYPLVLVTTKEGNAPVQVIDVADLPQAYRELGLR